MRYLTELANSGHLILSIAQRDIRAKYKQTAFGMAWAVIQPLSLMVVFTLVFAVVAKVPSDGKPYPLFAYSALIFWTCFAVSISQGTVAMTANAALVRKIYFPRETLLLSVMLSALIDLAISALVLAGLFAYYGERPQWTALWIPVLLGLQLLFTLAVILVTSAIHVNFRDIGHAVPLIMQLWLFATPIAYPLSSVPEVIRPYYQLNPMAGLIESYRRVLLHGEPPDFAYLASAAAAALVAVAIAYLVFKRAERTFADVI